MISKRNDNVTYNIDKLPLEVVGMLNILFRGEMEGFENAYMAEIKLDDPIKHIKDGDEFFIIHQSLDQYMSNAKHLFDKEWAVVHKKIFNMTVVDEERFDILLNKYFETGELAERPEPKPQEVRRKGF
jgi:hypothetical protein